jgi:hypothetical protein
MTLAAIETSITSAGGKGHIMKSWLIAGVLGVAGVMGLGAGTAEAHGPYYHGGGWGGGYGYGRPGFSISVNSGYYGHGWNGGGWNGGGWHGGGWGGGYRGGYYGAPVYGRPVYGGGYHRGCW